MEITLNTNRVLYKTLNDYFKNNIKLSIKVFEYLIIITKKDYNLEQFSFWCQTLQSKKISEMVK
jgi:hypothetical protein